MSLSSTIASQEECTTSSSAPPLRLSEATTEYRRFVISVAISACALQSSTGWHLGVLSGTMHMIEDDYQPGSFARAFLGITGLIGMLMVGLITGPIVDRIGRRKSVLIYCVTSGLLTLLIPFSPNIIFLNVVRVLIGGTLTLWYSAGPALVGEVSPPGSRGKLLSLMEATWYIGSTLSVLMAYLVHLVADAPYAWKYVHTFPILVVGPVGIYAYFRIPETPAWLIARNRLDEAQEVCEFYTKSDLLIRTAEPQPSQGKSQGSGCSVLFGPGQRSRTIFGCLYWSLLVIPTFAISAYSLEILELLGIHDIYSGNFIICAFSLVGVYGASFLVEKVGRRWIAIPQFLATGVALVVIGVYPDVGHVTPIFIFFMIYQIANAAGAILTSTYPAELFPVHVRGAGTGLMAASSRFFAMIGTFSMPFMLDSWGVGYTLIFCGVFAGIGALVCYLMAPETSGMTLAEAVKLKEVPTSAAISEFELSSL